MTVGPPTKSNFREWFKASKVPPAGAKAEWYRRRGRQFERALYHLLKGEGLRPRTNFRPKAEEIDGSFEYRHKYFLLEAKWRKGAVGLAPLDSFDSKVGRKLSGTLGVFISMSGYTPDAADALVKGRSLSVVLFDGSDVEACFHVSAGFRQVLEVKLRNAAEFGLPYFPYKPTVVSVRPPTSVRRKAR